MNRLALFITTLILMSVFAPGLSVAKTMRFSIENEKIVNLHVKPEIEEKEYEVDFSLPAGLSLSPYEEKEIINSLFVVNEDIFATNKTDNLTSVFPSIKITPTQNYKITYDKDDQALVFQPLPLTDSNIISKKENEIKLTIIFFVIALLYSFLASNYISDINFKNKKSFFIFLVLFISSILYGMLFADKILGVIFCLISSLFIYFFIFITKFILEKIGLTVFTASLVVGYSLVTSFFLSVAPLRIISISGIAFSQMLIFYFGTLILESTMTYLVSKKSQKNQLATC